MNEPYLGGVEVKPAEVEKLNNFFTWQQIDDVLPSGIGYATTNLYTGRDMVGNQLKQILSPTLAATIKARGIHSLEHSLTGKKWLATNRDPQDLIGTIIGSIPLNRTANYAIDVLLRQYPNLCWLRGGEYMEREGIPIVGRQLFHQNPLCGYIGDFDAIRLAYEGYLQTPRKKPTLYVVYLRDIIEGARRKILQPKTEHSYDVYLGYYPYNNGEIDFLTWSKKSVKAFLLGPEDSTKAAVEKLLLKKAIST